MCCGDRRTSPEARELLADTGVSPSAVAVIQARLNSSRFPGKILADLHGKPVIQHVLDQARQIKGVDDVVIAVPDQETFDAVVKATDCQRVVWYGDIPENDVLARFAAVARQFLSHSVIVRLTADNPLIDPRVASDVLADFRTLGVDYHSNLFDNYIDGTDVEVFSAKLLLDTDAALAADDPRREHVTPAMGQPVVTPRTDLRLTIDTPEDLERVRELMVDTKA